MYALDSRRVERYSLQVPIMVKSLDEAHLEVSSVTRNISSGGVCFEAENSGLDPGEGVHVEVVLTIKKLSDLFSITDRIVLKVNGLVARTTNNGIAVKFSKAYSIKPLL